MHAARSTSIGGEPGGDEANPRNRCLVWGDTLFPEPTADLGAGGGTVPELDSGRNAGTIWWGVGAEQAGRLRPRPTAKLA
jgi:hypothetical protein